jgi:PAS domain S-box-containing protein
MGEALLVLNQAGVIQEVNPAAVDMLGYDADELKGMSIGDVFEEDDEEQAGAFMGTWLEALIRTGALKAIEARFVTKAGVRIPILFSRTAVSDEQGRITDIICIAKDMSGYIRVNEKQSRVSAR